MNGSTRVGNLTDQGPQCTGPPRRCNHSTPMAGYSIKLLPYLAVAALLFGALFVYIGVNTIVLGAPLWGAGITVFGILGLLLAGGFWRARKLLVVAEQRLREQQAKRP